MVAVLRLNIDPGFGKRPGDGAELARSPLSEAADEDRPDRCGSNARPGQRLAGGLAVLDQEMGAANAGDGEDPAAFQAHVGSAQGFTEVGESARFVRQINGNVEHRIALDRRHERGKAMITVTAPIWLWSGEGGRWHFLTIPAEEAVEIRLESAASGIRRGFGSVRVNASINGVAWKTSVFPQKTGGYLLPVKAAVRRDAGIAAGDAVTVSIELL